jgi:hypothetical protein
METPSIQETIRSLAVAARAAAAELRKLSTEDKNAALRAVAAQLRADRDEIYAANAEDEKAAVADIYEQRNEGLRSLFASSAYKAMTDADKEKAVSVLYDLYYDKALSEALGVDRGNALLFANAIGYGKYAAFKTRISGITSDKDKDGNTVQGSKRAKVVKTIVAMDLSREEKLLLIASSGYSLQDGDIRGISAVNAKRMLLKYILSMKGTQAEKAALAEACGFEVKNGKILKNSL